MAQQEPIKSGLEKVKKDLLNKTDGFQTTLVNADSKHSSFEKISDVDEDLIKKKEYYEKVEKLYERTEATDSASKK